MAGTEGSPARLAAFHRRSPATSWYRSSARGRTRMGWSTPSSRTDAVSAASASSWKARRGWLGFEVTLLTGTSMNCRGPASLDAASDGIRAPRPRPRPLRRATAHLLGQLPIGNGSPGGRIERGDRLPERRRLGKSHGSRHQRAGHLLTEMGPDFMDDLIAELRPGVVHHED